MPPDEARILTPEEIQAEQKAFREQKRELRETHAKLDAYDGPPIYPPIGFLALAERQVETFPTGFQQFDEKFGGLYYGRVSIIAARPSHGKSALALEVARRAAQRRRGWVVYFSAELSAGEIGRRFRRRRDLKDGDHLLVVEDDHPTTRSMDVALGHIESTREEGIELAIFDYLDYSGEKNSNEVLRLGQALQGCHELARKYHIPFIVIQQLSRGIETRTDPRPRLSDLRWSGSAEQIAAMVIMLQHPAIHYEQIGTTDTLNPAKTRIPEDWELDVYVRKNTHGRVGSMALHFDRETGLITDARDEPDPQTWLPKKTHNTNLFEAQGEVPF